MSAPGDEDHDAPLDDDAAALRASAREGAALCTVVHIEGSWSRRLGAQLAILPDGSTRGSLADGCLERALAKEALAGGPARVLRYGRDSPFLDIRLPCGSGVDIVVDPAPDGAVLRTALATLEQRQPARIAIGGTTPRPFVRTYLPRLRLMILGSGPEVAALTRLARAQRADVTLATPRGEAGDIPLDLGHAPHLPAALAPDPWTAIPILFHDHEWERGLIPWALASPAFYVGAQGGHRTRAGRAEYLTPEQHARLKSPIGLFPAARTPSVLALSVLAEVVAAYERLAEAPLP